MTATIEDLRTRLQGHFGDRIDATVNHCGELTLEVNPTDLVEAATALRDEFHFEQLIDVCGVDYLSYGQADWITDSATTSGFSRGVGRGLETVETQDHPRFAVAYHLLSLAGNVRLRVRVYLEGEPPRGPSLVDVWPAANWFEREAFDLYGILFEGHPDLRRILTDYGFIGHPFRKDFPLEGNVEMRYDPDKGRVVYQPVSIENRVLVPRVIRGDHDHA